MRRLRASILALSLLVCALLKAQINTEQMMIIGRNALYFEDYVLSIQYFNKVISAKPYLHEPYFFRGLAKFYLDDYIGAESDFTAAIEKNPYVSRSYQLRGLSRANIDKYIEAEADFRMAIKYDPQNPVLWQNLAVTAIKRENWDVAAAVIDSLLVFSPRNTDGYLMRTQVAVKQGDSLMAQRMIDEAVRNDEYSSDVYSMRAMLYAENERYEEAEKDIDRAIELMPGTYNYYLNRALIRYYRNNLRGAMEDYDMALYIEPDDFTGHYNRGLLRMQVGDDNRAIEDFDKVLSIDPDNTMARFNRALLRDNTGNIQGAIDDYTRVLDDYPNFEYGYQCRAVARRKIGDDKGADADEVWLLKRRMASHSAVADDEEGGKHGAEKEDKVRKRSDRNVRNYNKMIVSDEMEGKQYATVYRGKVQNRNVYVELEPMFAMTYYEQINEMASNGYFYKAIDDINENSLLPQRLLLTNDERALSKNEVERHFADVDIQSKNIVDDEDDLYPRLARALDFYLVQDFDSSIEDLNIALTLDGDIWPVYFVRATVRYKQLESQHVNDANADAMIGTKPDNALPNINYRLVKWDLDKVIDLVPDFAYAYYNRGNVHAKLSDFKSAVVDYTSAIEIDDKLAEAYYNRGLAKIYLGNTDDGINDLSKAGELGIYTAYNVIKRFKNATE